MSPAVDVHTPPPSLADRVANDAPVDAETYLDQERTALHDKHEFWNGWLIQMPGASLAHNLIVANVSGELRRPLYARDCRVVSSDMRVAIAPEDAYTYPDLVVYCGDAEVGDEHGDILHNPQIIVEVLSSSTEGYDRGKKFAAYRNISSLQEYVLIDQHEPYVECFRRGTDGHWTLYTSEGLDATLRLESVEIDLLLSEIYLNVFPKDASDTDEAAGKDAPSTASDRPEAD
jgi:Uma2 family endonuclease